MKIIAIKSSGHAKRPWPLRSVRLPAHPRRWRADAEIIRARHHKEDTCQTESGQA